MGAVGDVEEPPLLCPWYLVGSSGVGVGLDHASKVTVLPFYCGHLEVKGMLGGGRGLLDGPCAALANCVAHR